jgi:hypothetical protein
MEPLDGLPFYYYQDKKFVNFGDVLSLVVVGIKLHEFFPQINPRAHKYEQKMEWVW